MTDIAIIGGGPAGLTAGLYAARGGASVTLFEELFVGGQIARTERIDNMPGFPDGLDGYEVGSLLQKQAERFGLRIVYESVTALSLEEDQKRVSLPSGDETAEAVVLCMGASPRKLGMEREEALTGAGVSYCATCDGAFFREKDVVVVGGGDTALSDALYLARFCTHVTLVHRRDEFRGSASLQKAAFAEPRIGFALSCVPDALIGESRVEGLRVKDVKTNETRVLEAAGVFVAVGVVPKTELVRGQVPLARDGSIETDARLHTGLAGVFAAGDVRDTPLRQVVTACADGALAATSALAYLAERR